VALSVINGRIVVEEGRLTTVDLPVLIETHNRLARALVQ
jgi:8-oxoguanine deaminase